MPDATIENAEYLTYQHLFNDNWIAAFAKLFNLTGLPRVAKDELKGLDRIINAEAKSAYAARYRLIKKYGVLVSGDPENGTYTMAGASGENAISFIEAFKNLCATQFKTYLTGPIQIPLNQTTNFTTNDEILLDGLVEFKDSKVVG